VAADETRMKHSPAQPEPSIVPRLCQALPGNSLNCRLRLLSVGRNGGGASRAVRYQAEPGNEEYPFLKSPFPISSYRCSSAFHLRLAFDTILVRRRRYDMAQKEKNET
jgi:hypothetical protein